MYIKLFFATLVTALSTNLQASTNAAVREIMNFGMRGRISEAPPTANLLIIPIQSSNRIRGIIRSRAEIESESDAPLSIQSISQAKPIILKPHTDLNAAQKTRRIENLEKLKIIAALELGRAITNAERKKAASKFSTYTKMQLNIAKSI